MKRARLIKKPAMIEQPLAQKSSAEPRHSLNHAVNVVTDWVKERRTTQQGQTRQVFAALFAHPQS